MDCTKRVRSNTHAAHEGTWVAEVHGVHVIRWDSNAYSYLHKDEFAWL
jgi:hypothetical protein